MAPTSIIIAAVLYSLQCTPNSSWQRVVAESAGDFVGASSCEADEEVKGCVGSLQDTGHCLWQLCQLCCGRGWQNLGLGPQQLWPGWLARRGKICVILLGNAPCGSSPPDCANGGDLHGLHKRTGCASHCNQAAHSTLRQPESHVIFKGSGFLSYVNPVCRGGT